jgi:hypothetical protein
VFGSKSIFDFAESRNHPDPLRDNGGQVAGQAEAPSST